MSYDQSNITELYTSDEYIEKNPSLHEEDSSWKILQTIPLIDTYLRHTTPSAINLLDVGGGAGIIVKGISSYIRQDKAIKVNKFALDLSPGMLQIQKQNNPDLVKALNEDISKTSLQDKEIDLTLMIDVLEHIPNPAEALKELRRISKFIIFKVPTEDNLTNKVWNFVRRGRPRQNAIETIGHINVYSFSTLKQQLQMHAGSVVDSYFTNVSAYYLSSEHYKNKWGMKNKLMYTVARSAFKVSPNMSSTLFGDFAMVLVKSYDK